MNAGATPTARTHDSFLDGRITLVQSKSGQRAGLDAALLQAVVPDDAQGLVVDLGCGCGAIGLCIAARCPQTRILGLDVDRDALALGEAALGLPENTGISGRVKYANLDLADGMAALKTADIEAGTAEWVVMNPPFHPAESARGSPDPVRERARIADAELLPRWMEAAAFLLKAKARMALITRADQLPYALAALGTSFGDARALPIHPAQDKPAKRIILCATKASAAPFRLYPGLILHEGQGGWTDRADRILRGQETLAIWD